MGIKLPPLIGDGMVLQRDRPVTLWGEADEPVTVTFLGSTHHALPDAKGRWQIPLGPLAPGGPFELCIGGRTLQDVYVGDVWLCAGQSNMQLPMQRVRHAYPETMEAENPAIRQFAVPERYDFRAPRAALEDGCWSGASIDAIPDFTAVGFFFARHLYARYGVPIGLIQTAVGGTPIHCWMDRAALAPFPEALSLADRFADEAYRAAVLAGNERDAARFFEAIDATDPGLPGGWMHPDYDDGAWPQQPLTEAWQGTGSVWLRKTVQVPPRLAGLPATLFLGTIVDWDEVYVNGDRIGGTTYRYPPRVYEIPALPQGRMVIAVRAVSKAGGGFTPGKPHLLATEAGSIPLGGAWRFHRGGHADEPAQETFIQYQPTGLYHGMIAPLMRYPIRGAIWYQGESDAGAPDGYADKFEAMVRCWREGWNDPLPVLFVELAHWEGNAGFAALRREQWRALRVAGTAMAVANELGEYNDLHPQGKRPVGERLARCAMRVAYGERLPHSPFEVVGAHGEEAWYE